MSEKTDVILTPGQKAYRAYLASDDWKAKRRAKFGKKLRQCAVCGALDDLHVHHLAYRSWYDVKQSDLRIFCRRCHEVAHQLILEKTLVFSKEDNHHSHYSRTKVAVLKYINCYCREDWEPPFPRRILPTSNVTRTKKMKTSEMTPVVSMSKSNVPVKKAKSPRIKPSVRTKTLRAEAPRAYDWAVRLVKNGWVVVSFEEIDENLEIVLEWAAPVSVLEGE